MLKLDKPFRDQEIFYHLSFFNSLDLDFEIVFFSSWLIFCSLDPHILADPVQEANILRIPRILSTGLKQCLGSGSARCWLPGSGSKG